MPRSQDLSRVRLVVEEIGGVEIVGDHHLYVRLAMDRDQLLQAMRVLLGAVAELDHSGRDDVLAELASSLAITIEFPEEGT